MRTRIPSGRSSDKHCTESGAANIPFNGSSWKATSLAPETLFRPALGNPTPNSCAFSRSLEKLKRNSRDTRSTLNPPIWAAAICQSSSGIGSRPCFCLRHSANRALSFSKFLVAIWFLLAETIAIACFTNHARLPKGHRALGFLDDLLTEPIESRRRSSSLESELDIGGFDFAAGRRERWGSGTGSRKPERVGIQRQEAGRRRSGVTELKAKFDGGDLRRRACQ